MDLYIESATEQTRRHCTAAGEHTLAAQAIVINPIGSACLHLKA